MARLAYYLLTTVGLSALGFGLVTAVSKSWRSQGVVTTLVLGACMGVLSLLLTATGLAMPLISPLISFPAIRAMPIVRLFIVYSVSGFLAGAVAVGLSWLIRYLKRTTA